MGLLCLNVGRIRRGFFALDPNNNLLCMAKFLNFTIWLRRTQNGFFRWKQISVPFRPLYFFYTNARKENVFTYFKIRLPNHNSTKL